MAPDEEDAWKRKMEKRVGDMEKLGSLLKNELSGLQVSIRSLLAADREKLNALEGHHLAYAAASQRAEYAEARALQAEKRTESVENELVQIRVQLKEKKSA